MITITFIPKNKENEPYFFFDVPFDGNSQKKYTCNVIESNAPCPEIIGFVYKDVAGVNQQHLILKLNSTCNQRQMKVEFMTQTESINKEKAKFITWLSGFLTWFNFIFVVFSFKTLKFITKAIAVGLAVPVAFGLIYAVTEYSYERIYDENFEDSTIVEYWSNFTIPAIGRYFREDAIDDAGDFKDFITEKTGDAIEATRETAEDLKDSIADKIDDIKD